MSTVDMFYLGLVLAAFLGFAGPKLKAEPRRASSLESSRCRGLCPLLAHSGRATRADECPL